MRSPSILLYHSISSEGPRYDNFSLQVSESNFTEHIRYLKTEHTLLPLSEFVSLFEIEHLPSNAIALTFDDGYADNLKIVSPLLHAYSIPATFFLCTGLLGREFWWDRLERLIYTTERLPKEFCVQASRSLEVRIDCEKSAYDRARIFMEVWGFLYAEEPTIREISIDRLADKFSSARTSTDRTSLAPNEVKTLVSDLLEIGAHTVSHRSLAGLSVSQLEWEVVESKRHCEELGFCSVSSFSYPHGEFDRTAQAVVMSSGFELACAVGGTHIKRGDSRFALPRLHVKDWSVEDFAARLAIGD